MHVQIDIFNEADITIKSLLVQIPPSFHGGAHFAGEPNQSCTKSNAKCELWKELAEFQNASSENNVLVPAHEIPRKECHPTRRRDTYPFSSLPWFSHRSYCPRTFLSWSRSWRWKTSNCVAFTMSQSSADLFVSERDVQGSMYSSAASRRNSFRLKLGGRWTNDTNGSLTWHPVA